MGCYMLYLIYWLYQDEDCFVFNYICCTLILYDACIFTSVLFTEEFDSIEKETHLVSSAPPYPTRESKPMSVEVIWSKIQHYERLLVLVPLHFH